MASSVSAPTSCVTVSMVCCAQDQTMVLVNAMNVFASQDGQERPAIVKLVQQIVSTQVRIQSK